MTPLSIISLYKSLPSRVRSPTPAKTENPPGKRKKTRLLKHLNQLGVLKFMTAASQQPTMSLGNIVDKFHNKHSFSYTGTTK